MVEIVMIAALLVVAVISGVFAAGTPSELRWVFGVMMVALAAVAGIREAGLRPRMQMGLLALVTALFVVLWLIVSGVGGRLSGR